MWPTTATTTVVCLLVTFVSEPIEMPIGQWRNFGLKSEGTKQNFWLGVLMKFRGSASYSKKWGVRTPVPAKITPMQLGVNSRWAQETACYIGIQIPIVEGAIFGVLGVVRLTEKHL